MNNRVHNLYRLCRRRGRPGFTLVELLIGMAMLAMIMVAVALAMRGAADASAYGADKSRSLTQATLALARLSSDLRGAATVDLTSSHAVTLTMPTGEQRSYAWSGAEGAPLVFASGANPGGNTLVPEVLDFSLQATMAYSEIAGAIVPVTVEIVLEVRHGQAETRLETAVRPRRNIL